MTPAMALDRLRSILLLQPLGPRARQDADEALLVLRSHLMDGLVAGALDWDVVIGDTKTSSKYLGGSEDVASVVFYCADCGVYTDTDRLTTKRCLRCAIKAGEVPAPVPPASDDDEEAP